MGCIYLIKNLRTNKCYVGQTINSLHTRWLRHQNDSRSSSYPIHQAMSKYGIKNFSCEIVINTSNENLKNLEAYYAEQYGSYIWQNGYNAVICDKHFFEGFKHTEKAKAKIRAYRIGRTWSDEVKAKISESSKRTITL